MASGIRGNIIAFLLFGVGACCSIGNAQTPRLELAKGVRPFVNSSFALAVAPDGSEYSIGGRRGVVVSYDAATHKELRRIEHPEGMVLDLAYCHSPECLVAVGDPRRLRVLSRGGQTVRQTKLPYRCGFVAVHPRLPIVALSGRSPQESSSAQQLLFVNVETGKLVGGVRGNFRRAFQLNFAPDGRRLYAVADIGQENAPRHALLEITTEQLTSNGLPSTPSNGLRKVTPRRLYENQGPIRNLALAPDGRHIAVMTPSGTVVLLDCQSRNTVYTWTGDSDRGNVLEFFTDRLLVASGQGQWRVYAVDQLEPLGVYSTDDSSSANHLLPLPSLKMAISSHARANQQLMQWKLSGFAERPKIAPGGLAGPAVPSMTKPPQPRAESAESTTEVPKVATINSKPAETPIAEAPTAESPTAETPTARTWTHAASGRQLRATLIGRDRDDLLLVGENGDELVVSQQTLSPEDQAYVDQQHPTELSKHVLASPAVRSGAFRGSIAKDDLRWLNQQLQLQHPNRPLRLSAAMPNGRGGAWIATELGLASFTDNQLTLTALVPQVPADWNIDLAPHIATMVGDRFGRPVVQWGGSREAFRWNGDEWIHLPADGGLSPSWLTRAGDSLYALLSTGEESEATIVAKLNGSRWQPWSEGESFSDLRQLYGSDSGHLVGVRSNKPPVHFSAGGAHEFEAPRLDAHALKMLKSIYGPMPKVAVTNDGAVHYIRETPTKASLELVSAFAPEPAAPEARREPIVHTIRVEQFEQPIPTGVDVDAQGRLWLQVTPSQSERAAQIVNAGKFVPSNAGVFVRSGDRWKRVAMNATEIPVNTLRDTDRDLSMNWISSPAYRPFAATREWQTADGKHKTQAAVRDLTPTTAKLLSDRGEVSIARNQMSTLDRQFLERLGRFRQRSGAAMPKLERRWQQRTAGDTFVNEDWQAMLERGEILPKIDQVAAPRHHPESLNHIWVISHGQVARWDGSSLAWAPRLQQGNTLTAESPEQIVVDDAGVVYVCCRDQQVRMLSQGRWLLMDQGMDLAVQRLRVVRGQLLAVVGQHSAVNRARGAPKSPFTGVMQWSDGQWRPLVRSRYEDTGAAFDVAALEGGESDQVAVSWTSNRFLACTLGRTNAVEPARMPALDSEQPFCRIFTIADGMLYAVGASAPFSDLRCLWSHRQRRFALEHASHQWRSRKTKTSSLHVDSQSMIWGWDGQPFCASGARLERFEIQGESPRNLTLVGDDHVALWGSHLTLYAIVR